MSMPSETSSRKLKTPKNLTRRQLWLLKNEAGYRLVAETAEGFEFERPVGFIRMSNNALAPLTQSQEDALAQRCARIADFYLDPFAFRDEIINRIRNITRTMNAQESDFCWGWVERNLDYSS